MAPGDYHETDDAHVTSVSQLSTGDHGGVVVHTANLHIRGMNRDSVIVDGTRAGATTPCSSNPQDQNFGPVVGGKAQGRNGIVVWKANDVSIENLTVCKFLWLRGRLGQRGLVERRRRLGQSRSHRLHRELSHRYRPLQYRSFGGRVRHFLVQLPGSGQLEPDLRLQHERLGMYVGACLQLCDVTIDHAWMENNALGYSGTNSGGSIVIENSQFDNNQDGIDTNTQIAGDPPPPQNGACPNGGTSPITTPTRAGSSSTTMSTTTTTVTPPRPATRRGPIGTGMTLSGGRNDTVMDNTFANNGAWGTLFVPYPDSGTPSLHQKCANYGGYQISGRVRLRDGERRAAGQHI